MRNQYRWAGYQQFATLHVVHPDDGEPIEAPFDRLRHIKLVAYYRVARDELGIHVNPCNQTSNPTPLLLVYLLQPALASDGVTWS